MKQINVNSDLKLAFYLLDINGRTIDPSTVDVSINLYTDGLTKILFSAKNGVYTNCKSVNSALIVTKKDPALNKGVLKAEVTLRIADADFVDGIDESVDVKLTDVEIVDDKTSIFNDQGIKFTAVVLTKVMCTDATQGNMTPAGLTEQFVKDIINKELSDANIASKVDAAGFLKADMAKVDTVALLAKGKDAGLAADDLSNVDDADLFAKGKTAGLADKDLSNVDAITNAKEGAMFYKKGANLVEAPVSVDDTNKKLKSKYSLEVPPNSVAFGRNTSLHENGGFLEYETNSLGKKYIILDYENDPTTGSSKPIYFKRGALETKFLLQPDYSKTMTDVTEVDMGNPAFDRQVDAIYIRLANKVSGLKMMVNINGNDVADYPTGSWDDDTVAGLDFVAGEQKIALKPAFTGLTEYAVKLKLKADGPISLLGNDTLPFVAYDMHRITRHIVAMMEDVPDTIALGNKADKNLGNVSNADMLKKGGDAGLLQQDLADVDLQKLHDKGIDAKLLDGVKVGQMHGDYRQGKVGEINFHNNIDVTFDKDDPRIASISIADVFAYKLDFDPVKAEVERLKTDISADESVFSYRGAKAPTYSNGPAKAYYLNITNASNGFALKLPADAPVNALFTVRNSDKANPFILSVDSGTINNGVNTYNIQENGLALFIKNSSTNWNAIYGGYMANNLKQLISLIKAQLPANSGLTIDEIQAQLKDRLHLFSEIQTEFNNELHTFDAIEANMISKGFSKGFSVGYGMLDTDTPPQTDTWVTAFISPNAEVVIPATNQGDKYLAIYLPIFLSPLVSAINVNSVAQSYTERDIVANELKFKVLIANDKVSTNSNIRLSISFANAVVDGVGVADTSSNVFAGVTDLQLGAGFTASAVPNDPKSVKIDYAGGAGSTFVDGLTGQDFTPAKVKSLDKSIRISKLQNGDADLSLGTSLFNSGMHVCLGNDEMLNSKYPKAKMYFSDVRVKGDAFVYPDMDTKSFVLQDVDPTDDPNVSGGTTFLVALYYEPNFDFENTVTQNGAIQLGLFDDNDNPVLDIDGNPMGAQIDYKANDKLRPELYVGECLMSAFTRVHLKINLLFANEEIISVGANTQLCFQAITKEASSGLALLSFMTFTGYRFTFDHKYYGFNSLNLASRLVFDVPEADTGTATFNFGENLYIDFRRNVKLSIQNYHLVIRDDNRTLPVWSIIKQYDRLDSHNMSGKKYKVTVTLTDKDDAFRVALMKYTGTTFPAPTPRVESYLNSNPVFTTGWQLVDSMFISEDAVAGDHTQSQEFNIPADSKELAVIMYPDGSQSPLTLKLKDLEGDITPAFSRVVITDNSHIKEQYLESHENVYKGVVSTPSGDLAYRYTANAADTKVPVGVITGGGTNVVNDHAWQDAGSIDPNRTQGDIKFLADGLVKMTYVAKCFNEQGSLNQIQFWLAKVNQNGSFTEVPNSRTASTIEAQRTTAKMIRSFEFTFKVLANESYRMFMKSDKDDGFYLQSGTDGVPLFRIDLTFDEITAEEKIILDKLKTVDDELVITDAAKAAGYYIELSLDQLNKPVLSPKKR